MSGTCRVTLLGRFSVEVNGRAVPASAWHHDSDALVKLLALEATHRLPRGQVVSQLWPGARDRAAARRVDKAVRGACKALGDGRGVTIDGETLRLWPTGRLEVDLLRFEVIAKHVGSERGALEALSLYGGELLPDDRKATWTDVPRRRSRDTYLRLLEIGRPEPGVIDLDHVQRVFNALDELRPRS